MSTCTLLPTFSPLGVVVKNQFEDSWLEDFLDLESLQNNQEHEERITMRRSLRINDQQLKAKNQDNQYGKKRRKSLDFTEEKSENEEEEEEEIPKIPTSKSSLLRI